MNLQRLSNKISAFCLLLSLTLAACSSSGNTNGNNVNTANNANVANSTGNVNAVHNSNTENARNEYPQESLDAFLQACEDSGAAEELCTCMLERIQSRYTFEAFTEIENKMRSGKTPDDFVEFSNKARTDCTKQP